MWCKKKSHVVQKEKHLLTWLTVVCETMSLTISTINSIMIIDDGDNNDDDD